MNPDTFLNLDGCFECDVPPGNRRIAWDGLSFCVPSNWELAVFRFLRRGVSRIELEDEYAVRVEAEWVRSRKGLKLDRIMKRYEEASKPLTLKSEERKAVQDLPEGWTATHFVFKETATDDENPDLHVTRHDLITAFYLCPRSSVFCFFLLHFLPEDTENPLEIIKGLAATFQDHSTGGLVPWQLFDISFQAPRGFALDRAQFGIGTKMMLFRWKRRRFYLWHFSCAEMYLKNGVTPAEWVSGYLNGFGGIKGPVFYPASGGGIAWRKRSHYLFGHRDEIAHWCHRYAVGWRRLEEEDQLVAWVFNYRREEDLGMMK